MPQKNDILIGQLLINKGIITAEQLEEGLREQKKTGHFISTILVRLGFATQEKVLTTLSEHLNIPYLNLKARDIDPLVIKKVPAKFASYYKIIPVEIDNNVLVVAMIDPLDVRTLDDIRLLLGVEVRGALSSETEIQEAIHKYYGVGVLNISGNFNETYSTLCDGLKISNVPYDPGDL
ncbi:MAG: hypothetical protein Q8N62_01940 [Candidatus Omnitrophota bacterium]|nr:hypothetical protein [Candidatus Omnitrophota bacterium]